MYRYDSKRPTRTDIEKVPGNGVDWHPVVVVCRGNLTGAWANKNIQSILLPDPCPFLQEDLSAAIELPD
jgi:hypothetical protein